jgi:peptidoglycan hydrolase-like protein with peptidoglycan-binding domain
LTSRLFRLRAVLAGIVVCVAAGLAAQSADAATTYKFGQRTLRQGMAGRDVKVLQQFLTKLGLRTTADGQFGRRTRTQVQTFERNSKLRADGVVTSRDARVMRVAVRNLNPGVGGAAYVAPPPPPPTTGKATIGPDGLAIAPAGAPAAVKQIIAAGNQIAKLPYRYGGGHSPSFVDNAYDCSGSVSYALHGAGLVSSPMPSGSYYAYGQAGPGQWVTLWTNDGHIYMEVAGLRFDTSARSSTGGNRWTALGRSNAGFTARHPAGL